MWFTVEIKSFNELKNYCNYLMKKKSGNFYELQDSVKEMSDLIEQYNKREPNTKGMLVEIEVGE